MSKKMLSVYVLAGLLLGLVVSLPASAAPQQAANLLTNGGAEDGGYYWQGVPQVYVAKGWQPWWHDWDTRPEYKLADISIDPVRVKSGNKAHQWFNTYATHTAGVYQRVTGLTPGSTLLGSGWVQTWTSGDNDPRTSDGRYRLKIGIDPYGGTDPESTDIVWSDTVQPYDQYFEVSVECVAKSDRATFFVWGQAEWAMRHNNGYTDDLAMVQEGVQPTPTPTRVIVTPTATPKPGEPTPIPPDLVDQIATETHKRVIKTLGEGFVVLGQFLLEQIE